MTPRNADTRERIFEAALDLFGTRGFEQTTMRDIAQAVGIKAPSLYKHFASKQQIFDALLVECDRRMEEVQEKLGISLMDVEAYPELLTLGPAELVAIGLRLFDFLLHETLTARFRRMLVMRQFADTTLAERYTALYFEAPLSYQAAFLEQLVLAGRLRACDPRMMALAFYAPVHLLIARCDATPAFEPQARVLVKAHIEQFFVLFKAAEPPETQHRQNHPHSTSGGDHE
jgi:AcrR family transcriptional regulator